MLTIDYRPRRFAEIVGQREPVAVMRAVATMPDSAPRVYLMQGGRGLGKTTLSRAFARALICKGRVNGDACLTCDSCTHFSDGSQEYQEYDATQVGNVKFMRELHDHLLYTGSTGWRVIVLDECQSATTQAQSALLKLLEEGPRNTFFIACTTDPDKILQTIRSRSVELSFVPVADTEVASLLTRIAQAEKVDLPPAVLDSIVSFSFGYVREAVMRLGLYLQVRDPEKFMSMMYIPEKDIIVMFESIKVRNRDEFQKTIERLSAYPLAYLKKSFEVFILKAIRIHATADPYGGPYLKVVNEYDNQLFAILGVLTKDWAVNCFKSDLTFQALMWYLFSTLSKDMSVKAPADAGRFSK